MVGLRPPYKFRGLLHNLLRVNKAEEVQTGDSRGEPAHWAVVDDNPGILQVVSTMISIISGANTSCFESGEEALAAVREQPDKFELVITDLEMPRMNGLELRDELRLVTPRLKVALMTGNHAAMDESSARLMGFCGLIFKPFSPADLKRFFEGAGLLQSVVSDRELDFGPQACQETNQSDANVSASRVQEVKDVRPSEREGPSAVAHESARFHFTAKTL